MNSPIGGATAAAARSWCVRGVGASRSLLKLSGDVTPCPSLAMTGRQVSRQHSHVGQRLERHDLGNDERPWQRSRPVGSARSIDRFGCSGCGDHTRVIRRLINSATWIANARHAGAAGTDIGALAAGAVRRPIGMVLTDPAGVGANRASHDIKEGGGTAGIHGAWFCKRAGFLWNYVATKGPDLQNSRMKQQVRPKACSHRRRLSAKVCLWRREIRRIRGTVTKAAVPLQR
jgi:hypothetical protein